LVRFVDEKSASTLDVLQDAALAFASQVDIEPIALRDDPHQRLRDMRREVVNDEYPFRRRLGRDGVEDVEREILLVAGRAKRRVQELAGGEVEICREAGRPVPNVLELTFLDVAGRRWPRRSCPLQGLDPGLLVAADDAHTLSRQPRGVSVDVADGPHLQLVRLVVGDLRIEPVLRPMRPD
jgi:hypothetical protein